MYITICIMVNILGGKVKGGGEALKVCLRGKIDNLVFFND